MNRSFGNSSYPSTNSRMSTLSTDWEDLRKQARQLENEIDAKLVSFSKLCSNYVAREHASHHLGIDSPPSPTSSSFDVMSIEIEKLLERLSDVNKHMTDAIPALIGPTTAATHTLQRHYEISQDYRREFERTKANIRNFKTREDLLMNNNSEVNSAGLSSRRQEYFSREMEQIKNSHKLIDENLEKAGEVKRALEYQRKYFLNITHKIKIMSNRFPLIINLLQRVRIKKRKDSLVLGFVIALCLILLLFYLFR